MIALPRRMALSWLCILAPGFRLVTDTRAVKGEIVPDIEVAGCARVAASFPNRWTPTSDAKHVRIVYCAFVFMAVHAYSPRLCGI
jgi:hypothetical protein